MAHRPTNQTLHVLDVQDLTKSIDNGILLEDEVEFVLCGVGEFLGSYNVYFDEVLMDDILKLQKAKKEN
jgi:hypothetical protein